MEASNETLARGDAVVRKAYWRLVPLCMCLYVLQYIDKVNVSFAALTMNTDLGLTAQLFGFTASVYYVMYSLFEVPSNIALAKFGARVWFARIMVTWGLATIATMFATGPLSLAALRAVVGAAEAGLVPGMIYYLGLWFPEERRASANALFFVSLPIGLLIGAPLSGGLLLLDGLHHLKGWQWLFLLTGLPSVLVGIAVYFVLPNGPKNARWLKDDERELLLELQVGDQQSTDHPRSRLAAELGRADVLVLGATYFCLLTTINALILWLPLIIKDVLGGSSGVMVISLMSGIPAVFAIPFMLAVSGLSDRTGRRIRYFVVLLLLGTAGWLTLPLAQAPLHRLAGLVACFMATYAALAVFFATATHLLARHHQAVALAIITTMGTMASIVGPIVIGTLRDWTHSFNASAWYGSSLLLLGVVGILVVSRFRRQ